MSPLSASAASSFVSATLTDVAARSLESDFNSFKQSFSSWDACMSKAYCKWPAIVGIIIGSLIVLSIVTSIARCLCCGLECCCGCFACLNACCPSPRGGSKTTYVQAPQQQQPWPQPYGWQPNMAYGPPMTATFDSPSKGAAQRARMVGNSDALPAMPSWQTSQNRRVEEEAPDDDAAEETALGETSPQAIPMSTVRTNASAGRQASGRTSNARAPVSVEEEQRMPMLNSQSPRRREPQPQPEPRLPLHQPQPQGYGFTGYDYNETTAYGGARSPVEQPQSPYNSSLPRRYPTQQSQRSYNEESYAPTPQSTTPFSPQHYQPNLPQTTNPFDYSRDYSYNNSQSHAPYPLDTHTGYADGAIDPPPVYQSRAATAVPAPAPSSPTYSSSAAAQYNSNPYAWGQSSSPVDRRDQTYPGSWSEDRPAYVARKPLSGSWRDV